MWTYSITGKVLTDGTRRIACYSGVFGPDQNNPDSCGLVGRGPLPLGLYDIGPAIISPTLGPVAMRLTPEAGTDEKGRSGFYLHGDEIAHPGHGSDGCICTNGPNGRADREYVAASKDKRLSVVR